MAKILTPSDLLGAMENILRNPGISREAKAQANEFVSKMEDTMSFGGTVLQQVLGVNCSAPDMVVDVSSDGMGYLAGTIAVTPQSADDPIPEELENIDPEGDWEPRSQPKSSPSP